MLKWFNNAFIHVNIHTNNVLMINPKMNILKIRQINECYFRENCTIIQSNTN